MDDRRDTSASWLVLSLRLALAVYLVGAAVAVLTRGIPAPSGSEAPGPWIPGHAGVLGYIEALLLGGCGLLLAAGLRTWRAALAAAGLLTAVTLQWLVRNPLHNTNEHLWPMVAAALAISWLERRGDAFALDRRWPPTRLEPEVAWSWIVLCIRIFLGGIFLAQGARSAFGAGGLIGFAQRVYVEPLADHWMPGSLLWVAGVVNPVIQLVTGAALVLGLRTRWAAAVVGLFLVQIVFGHTLADPWDAGGDTHDYAWANLSMAVALLAFAGRGDRFSLDAAIRRRRAAP